MKFHTVFVSAMMFAGCKDSGSNTGDVGVDFIFDSSNNLIDKKWANEEQKKKYKVLADLSTDECNTKMAQATIKLYNDPKLQENLPSEIKQAFVAMKSQSKQVQELGAESMAIGLCKHIAVLKKASA